MSRRWLFRMMLLAAVCLAPLVCFAEADEAEWTVLFYVCGSDLETKYSCATENLKEMAGCEKPVNNILSIVEQYGGTEKQLAIAMPGQVNVLIMTGGTKTWHAGELGIDIASNRLQTWKFEPREQGEERGTFRLERDLPLQNMAGKETLADYIRWGKENYPAKKYALVMWGHGGGSRTGILTDELFFGDIMRLDQLHDALEEGGVTFEMVLFDACMMANMETAWAIRENAKWMTASEELVAGKGSAVGEWLQQLYYVPDCDGKWLGRWICDMTQIKYADNDDQMARELMTWSVIDLSRIEGLVEKFDMIYRDFAYAYLSFPLIAAGHGSAVLHSESYGTPEDNMFDLAGIMFQDSYRKTADAKLQWIFQNAMTGVVDYCVRGSGRPKARGLSFCYPTNSSAKELDIYAMNCPSPHYLVFLDAISPWTAPDWLYEQVDPLPEMSTLDAYQVGITKEVFQDGTPAFSVREGNEMMVGAVRYRLYRKDEKTGHILSLGEAPAYYDKKTDPEHPVYRVYELQYWPALNKIHCEVDMLNEPRDGVYDILFNIPIRLGTETMYLRCAYRQATNRYEVYGVWDGYDANSALMNRNVEPLSQYAGQDFSLLYRIETEKKNAKTKYEPSETMKMYRALNVEEEILPPGTYYLDYVVYDVFRRPMAMERAEMIWDGESFRMPEGSWGGEQALNTDAYYESK